MGCIYKITNTINGKVYIGQTARSMEKRWKEHLRHGFNPKNHEYNLHLYKSMRKYGKDAFTIELIENCENNLMSEREIFWINFYNSSNPDFGYNITLGGEGARLIDYDEVYRRYDDGESAKKIAKEMGISRSNLTQILKGYEKYDKKTTWERAMKEISEDKGTPVSQYDLSGNFIAMFQSSKAAQRSVPKTAHANISRICKTKKGLSGGFQWRFSDDDPPGIYIAPKSSRAMSVCQLDEYGNLICIFSSIREASSKTGIDTVTISKYCKRYADRLIINGYMWCYEADYKGGQ